MDQLKAVYDDAVVYPAAYSLEDVRQTSDQGLPVTHWNGRKVQRRQDVDLGEA